MTWRAVVFVVAAIAVVATPRASSADPCPGGKPFKGVTVYRTVTYRLQTAGAWQNTWYGWYRDNIWTCTAVDKHVGACYSTSARRFWAWKGNPQPLVFTTATTKLTLPERRFKTGNIPPFDGPVPPDKQDDIFRYTVDIANNGSVPSLGAFAGRELRLDVVDQVGSPSKVFQSIAAQWDSLGRAFLDHGAASLGIPDAEPEHAALGNLFLNVGNAFVSAASELLAGNPVQRAPYDAIAGSMGQIANLLPQGAEHYEIAAKYLRSLVDDFNDMADLVGSGLGDLDSQIQFIGAIASAQGHFDRFAWKATLAHSPTGDLPPKVPGAPVWSLAALVALLGAAGVLTLRRSNARRPASSS